MEPSLPDLRRALAPPDRAGRARPVAEVAYGTRCRRSPPNGQCSCWGVKPRGQFEEPMVVVERGTLPQQKAIVGGPHGLVTADSRRK